ncbi:hypothetical protein LTR72_009939 [Exophiala xenobiotica]|nr:hypothetical protein LTR72_009939 [Exophiala xenobiotica]KAK5287606.1 hypothetical protein LTR14_008836 [Exophiala xenobiotica]KAK5475473.1 hypothetical protein LTR55_009101 [Exophiala xenobiotica]
MFLSIRDQGRRRRSQTYGVSKAARSSKLSLLSAISTNSHGSNDSSSTITQESYRRSTSTSGKRRRSSHTKGSQKPRERKLCSVRSEQDKPEKEKSMSRESVDVFAFLVDENALDTRTLDDEVAGVVSDVHEESDDESISRSQHSDSGISMGDSIVCQARADSLVECHLPSLPEESQETADGDLEVANGSTHSKRLRFQWPAIPRPTHNPYMGNAGSRTPSPENVRLRLARRLDDGSQPFKKPALSGYDLIAAKLGRGELPPVFRCFRKSNFRMLLQLQDEISEMEDELAALDLEDSKNRLNADGSTSPASRRISWEWTQSDLQAHRLDVLGRLYIKIEQYYQALLAAQKVQRLSAPASPPDVERFRAWLRQNNPLSAPESRFLDHQEDLICLDGSTAMPSTTAMSPSYSVPGCILATTLGPLLCFKIMTGVLNRLILLVVVLAIGLSSLEKLDRSKVEEHRQWILACFVVSLLAAVIL